MNTANPTQPLQALHRLAPGVVDGPYHPHHTRGERFSRALMLVMCIVAAVVVLVQIGGYL